jgi:hypothetical protein
MMIRIIEIRHYEPFGCQMTQKGFDFFGPHFLRMTNPMKTDETRDPLNVDLFGAGAVAIDPHGLSDAVEQFWWFWGGESGFCHPVAFLAHLPSEGQEIGDKLSSNSR